MSFTRLSLSKTSFVWLLVGAALSLSLLGSYYVRGSTDGEDTSVLILYRPGTGDRDYLPLARQYGEVNFREAYTFDHTGRAVTAFPGAALLGHGVALRWLGPVGFAVVDILTPVAYFLVSARLLARAGVASSVSIAIAFILTLQGFSALAQLLFTWFGYSLRSLPFLLNFLQCWDLRFPRKFVSDIYVLGALGNWVTLARLGLMQPVSWWVTTAAWMALVLQGDIYSFIGLCLAFSVAAILHFRSLPRRHLATTAKHAALLVTIGLALSAPLLIQRSQTGPDVLARYGVFSVSRSEVPALLRLAWDFFPTTYTLLGLLLPIGFWLVLRRASDRERLGTALALNLVSIQVSAYLAMPALVAVGGQGVQLYHFREAAHTLVAWSILITVALLLTTLLSLVRSRFVRAQVVSTLGSLALAGLALLLVWRGYTTAGERLANPGRPRDFAQTETCTLSSYRQDLRELLEKLDRVAEEGNPVLATTDVEVYAWWTGLRGRQSFLGHHFVSALPGGLLFERLAIFFRIAGVTGEQFKETFLNPRHHQDLSHWFSGNTYQATQLFSFAPKSAYRFEEVDLMKRTSPLECWSMIIPELERERLSLLFQQTAAPDLGRATRLPELVVWPKNALVSAAPQAGYRLLFENSSFQLFRLLPPQAGS